MTEPRTFKIEAQLMRGDDIRAWQSELDERFALWNIEYPMEHDGVYGAATRSATATFMRAWGVDKAQEALQDGLTPEWRVKLRNDQRTRKEQETFESEERIEYRRALRKRFDALDVCYPVPNLVTDAHGFGPGHDGVDLICPWKQPLLAICTGKIVRVDKDDWWGNNPKPSPGHPISEGDGIIILECTIADGPFRPGLHFGYGHAEGADVEEGDLVNAGQQVGNAGWANAPHTHFMVNNEKPRNGFYRGVGDRDPMEFLKYAKAHS